MDLLPLIVGAQTTRAAVERVQEATGLDAREAWQAIGRAVQGGAWAVLVAPELWLVLEEHYAVQRLSSDLRRARALRNRAHLAVRKLDPDLLSEGRDAHSDRVTAATRAQSSVIQVEAEMARRRDALHRYVLAYQARHSAVATMTPIEQAQELLRAALLAGRLELARELAAATARPSAEVTGSGFLATFADRVRGLFPHS